ncbi:hypothetical protein ABZ938_16430 [Streptomyces sp. NPDC046409]|uniref:hypothetical protein n=1 Tax=Streptomyces sp. NPDC046409 TaxID=3156675 RepID=UPI0033C851F3
MNRQVAIAPVARVRAIADNAERMAQELGRTVAAVERIVGDLKGFYEVVSPLVKRLR